MVMTGPRAIRKHTDQSSKKANYPARAKFIIPGRIGLRRNNNLHAPKILIRLDERDSVSGAGISGNECTLD